MGRSLSSTTTSKTNPMLFSDGAGDLYPYLTRRGVVELVVHATAQHRCFALMAVLAMN